MDFIESQAAAYPALAERYNEFGQLYSKKLWHQLTTKLAAFLADPASRQGDNWAQLYSGFIAHFEGRLNAVRLATIVGSISLSLPNYPNQANDPIRRPALLLTFLEPSDP